MLEIRKQRFGQQRTIHERHRRKRTATRVGVAVLVLVMLFIVGAVIYVWYVGQRPVQQAVETVNTQSAAPILKGYTPDPDAPVGIVQQSFSDPMPAGSNAAISIKTNPGAACQISVKVNNTALPDTGLVPKIADEFGLVNWSWTVPKGTLVGKWPVDVTCANEAKKSAFYRAYLEIVPSQ